MSTPESASTSTAPDRASRSSRRPRDWASWAGAAACLAAAAFAYREFLSLAPLTALEVPLSAEVESFFFEPSDTSPLLVLVFVAWLLYRRLPRLRRTLGHRGSPALTFALFAAGIAVFVWSGLVAAYDLQAVALFFEALAVAHAFGGTPALRITLVPASLLVFAVPIPAPLLNAIVWKFQLATAEYTGFLLHLIGQPALVSGDQILRSDQVFQIIETCSGLRTVETLAMLSVLMVDLFRRRGWHAALLIGASLPVGFLVNGARALTLIFNPHSDIATIHNAQGIAMLLGGVLLLYGLDGLLERALPQRPPPRHRAVVRDARDPSLRGAWLATVGCTVALVVLSLVSRPFPPTGLVTVPPLKVIDTELDGWKGTDRRPDRMFLGLASFVQILDRDYVQGRQRVNAFVGTAAFGLRYRSFYSPKTRVPTTGWIVEDDRRERIGDRDVEVLLVRRGARRLLIHHWRQGGRGLLAETLRAVLGLDRSPFHRPDVPLVVRLSTPVAGSPAGLAAGEERLIGFAKLLQSPLKELGTPRG